MTNDLLTESQLRRLLEVGRSLVTELDVEPLLREALQAAKELTGARYAALGILGEDKASLEQFIHLGIESKAAEEIGPLPQGRGVLGELMRRPEPLRIPSVGDHPRSFGFPPGHPPMSSFLGVPIMIRGEAFGNLYLTEKEDGGQFDARDEAMLVVIADWAAVAIDNARIHDRSEKRAGDLERAVHALETTVSLARVGAVETGFENLVELIAESGRELVGCETMILLSAEEPRIKVLAVAGSASAAPGETVLAVHAAIARARESDRVLRAEGELIETSDSGPVVSRAGLVAHLDHRGGSQGFLLALGGPGASFSEDDELLLRSFASAAANSIASARDVERDRLRRTIEASEQERRRWAMELHDETLQDLGALKVMHEGALVRGDPNTMRTSLENAAKQLEVTIASLESLIHELRPASLDALGIAAAVETLAERTCRRGGLESSTHIELSGDEGAAGRLAPQIEATIYRVVQETLNNSVKHADATRATVTIVERAGYVTVFIEDDGSGFDPEGGFSDRFGLHGMRERVELANGDIEIDSSPGRGTRVGVHLPAVRGGPRGGVVS